MGGKCAILSCVGGCILFIAVRLIVEPSVRVCTVQVGSTDGPMLHKINLKCLVYFQFIYIVMLLDTPVGASTYGMMDTLLGQRFVPFLLAGVVYVCFFIILEK